MTVAVSSCFRGSKAEDVKVADADNNSASVLTNFLPLCCAMQHSEGRSVGSRSVLQRLSGL